MPFPVEEKFVIETENELNVKFPTEFKNRMLQSNGGELENRKYHFQLYPFFDKSSKKRISRTCNHIGMETENAREWDGFPENAIAIGSDGSGNQLVLIFDEVRMLSEELFLWEHETREIKCIANSINKFNKRKSVFNIFKRK